jgi:hypothetical protein
MASHGNNMSFFCEIVFNSWTNHDKPIENKKVSHRMVPLSYKLVYKPH